jgi:protein-S-isoprenylcysteine O-methyltransferase Ste14
VKPLERFLGQNPRRKGAGPFLPSPSFLSTPALRPRRFLSRAAHGKLAKNCVGKAAALQNFGQTVRSWLASTPKRSFVLYPICVILFELIWRDGRLVLEPWGVPLLLWGYLQYRLCGNYRVRRGGGGPGFQKPPDRIVESGLYRYTRNPMYLGHLIVYAGLAVTFHSLAALALLLVHIPWFHHRVLEDEKHLEARFGAEYSAYKHRVKRWIPYLV